MVGNQIMKEDMKMRKKVCVKRLTLVSNIYLQLYTELA